MPTSDPRTKHHRPSYAAPAQKPPGLEKKMSPKADHGENSYKGAGKLTGKAAIITGGDSGIGRAVAIAFAREGADVLISYLSEHEDAKETARWVELAGGKAVLMAGDIGSEKHCKKNRRSGREGIRPPRYFGEQCRVPAQLRAARRYFQPRVRQNNENEHLCDVLSLSGRSASFEQGRFDYQHFIDPIGFAHARVARLRHDQGSDI